MLISGDNYYHSFPNLYAIRGTPTRDVLEWTASIDQLRASYEKNLALMKTYTPADWENHVGDTLAVLVHTAYHLGEIRQAVSIIKKRGGRQERTIREFRLNDGHISVGEALVDFRGVLTGVPIYDATGGPADSSDDD